jgi:hypothetical protein
MSIEAAMLGFASGDPLAQMADRIAVCKCGRTIVRTESQGEVVWYHADTNSCLCDRDTGKRAEPA